MEKIVNGTKIGKVNNGEENDKEFKTGKTVTLK